MAVSDFLAIGQLPFQMPEVVSDLPSQFIDHFYVNEPTDLEKSVFVLDVKGFRVFEASYGKYKATWDHNPRRFPYTVSSVALRSLGGAPARDGWVVLGMARFWDNEGKYSPRRSFLMVVGGHFDGKFY